MLFLNFGLIKILKNINNVNIQNLKMKSAQILCGVILLEIIEIILISNIDAMIVFIKRKLKNKLFSEY